MASFIRRLFGRPESSPPPAPPAPKPQAPKADPASNAGATGAVGKPSGAIKRPGKRSSQSIYTSTLGISTSDRAKSAMTLKALTGQ